MAQFNVPLQPVLVPPQLPYEVFQGKALASVLPEIAALEQIGSLLGEKLPRAIQERKRTQRLAEVFKAVDKSDYPDVIKGTLKENLIRADSSDDVYKVLDALFDAEKTKATVEATMFGHQADLYIKWYKAHNPDIDALPEGLRKIIYAQFKDIKSAKHAAINASAELGQYGQELAGVGEITGSIVPFFGTKLYGITVRPKQGSTSRPVVLPSSGGDALDNLINKYIK